MFHFNMSKPTLPKLFYFLIPLFIFVAALLYRGYKVQQNTPFWVDEFSTAFQANLMRDYKLNTFSQEDFYVEYHNFLPHLFVATSFELLGESTFAARLPFVIIGSLVPVLIWVFGVRVLKDSSAALAATVLTLFSYFEITWSRQARGYVIQQSLMLVAVTAYFALFSAKTKKSFWFSFITLLVAVICGVLTHLTFILVAVALILHGLWYFRAESQKIIRSNRLVGVLVVLGAALLGMVAVVPISNFIKFISTGSFPNNLPYYHSFLWREYGVLMILTIIGFVYGWINQRKVFSFFLTIIGMYLFFFSFIFEPKVTRYLLPIFPFVLISAGYGLVFLSRSFFELLKVKNTQSLLFRVIPVALALLIVINGDKFTVKPKSFYSVNHDFREIALIDYDRVYQVIKDKGELEKGQTAVIDPWGDRMAWYLGRDFKAGYFFRWTDSSELLKQTPFQVNDRGEKTMIKRDGMRLIGDLGDLQLAMQTYPKGFIWIDDTSLPADVIAFAEKNMKKELFLDHYTLDDNPYSIWPGTLYSWGVSQ